MADILLYTEDRHFPLPDKLLIFIVCVNVLPLCMHAQHMCALYQQKSEGMTAPRIGVVDCC